MHRHLVILFLSGLVSSPSLSSRNEEGGASDCTKIPPTNAELGSACVGSIRTKIEYIEDEYNEDEFVK